MGIIVYGLPIVLIVLFVVLVSVIAARWRNKVKVPIGGLFAVIRGVDGRPSTSKLQFALWTMVASYAYLTLILVRLLQHSLDSDQAIPLNVLIAMGLSAVTAVGAKSITVQYVYSGRLAKTTIDDTTTKTSPVGSIFQDDDGNVSLTKVQMIGWTLIAIFAYVITLVHQVNADLALNCKTACSDSTKFKPSLPDIDAVLMVLMGLGQGTYLANKLTFTTVPQITSLNPNVGKPSDEVTIGGSSFGAPLKDSVIIVDPDGTQNALTVASNSWTNEQIKFFFPQNQADGKSWTSGQQVAIQVSAGKQQSNKRAFTVTVG